MPSYLQKNFRNLIINDVTLKAFASPEKVYQFSKWWGLFEHLKVINIEYPDIVQMVETEDIEKQIVSMGKKYSDSIDRLVTHFL